MRDIAVIKGGVYRHFKGNYYVVDAVALNSEDMEPMVVYHDFYHEDKIWVRPAHEFMSKVDREKYPNVRQEYRFELIRGGSYE